MPRLSVPVTPILAKTYEHLYTVFTDLDTVFLSAVHGNTITPHNQMNIL